MINDIAKILIDEETLKSRVKELGKQLSRDYKDKELLMIGVLKGSVVFISDLMRAVDCFARIDFMAVSSYGSGTQTSGAVKILKDISIPLENYDVLLVEDILDSGLTLEYLRRVLTLRHPRDIKIAALLDKPERRKADIRPDYLGFTIPDEFVVGYGLDYDEKYRNLPFVGVLKPELYK